MKKIYLLLVVLIFIIGIGKIKYSKEDFFVKNDKVYNKKDNSVVTGTMVRGNLELDIKDGVIQKCRGYYPNGKLKYEINPFNYDEILYFENGKVAAKSSKNSIKIYFKNGKLKSEKIFENNGKRLIEREYFISGDIKREIIREGMIRKVIEVDDTYRREYTSNLKTLKEIGKYLVYENGVLRESSNYNEKGELIGENIKFNEDGEVIKKEVIGKDGKLEYSYSTSSIFGDFIQEKSRIEKTDRYLVKFINDEGDEKKFIYINNSGDLSLDYTEYENFKYDEYGLLQETNTTDEKTGDKHTSEYENSFLISETITKNTGYKIKKIYNNYEDEYTFLEKETDTDYLETKTKEIYPNGKLKYEIIIEKEEKKKRKISKPDGSIITYTPNLKKKMIEKFYKPNGELAYEIKNDEKEKIFDKEFYEVKKYGGKYRCYYKNGKLAFKGTYSEKGGLIGEAEMYDEKGNPIYKIDYKKNLEGISFPKTLKLYYPNRKIKIEKEFFDDNTPLVERYYYSDGKLMAINKYGDIEKGEYFLNEERFFPNGKSRGKTFYSNATNKILQGEYTRYYDDGTPKKIFNFDNGVINEYKLYYKNGKLKSKKDFTKDIVYNYFPTGELKEKIIAEGKKTQKRYEYWKNGKIKFINYFENSKKILKKFYSTGVPVIDGDKKFYPNGKIAYEEVEVGGKQVNNRYYMSGQIKRIEIDDTVTVFREDGIKESFRSSKEEIEYNLIGGIKFRTLFYTKVDEKNKKIRVRERKTYDYEGELARLEIYENEKLIKDVGYNLWEEEIDFIKLEKERKGEKVKNEK